MLDAIVEAGVHVTWATVGALFAEDRDELEHYWPHPRPRYENRALDPYGEPVGADECDDPLHYAPSLISRIADAPGQEVGSHTFTHYYCCERGQDPETFRADLSSAVAIAAARGIALRSLVLPRNQVNPAYDALVREAGFTSYRGNQCGWMHRGTVTGESPIVRAARLADAYVPLSGSGTTALPDVRPGQVIDLRASRFLRPWARALRSVESLRKRRIAESMTVAAARGEQYHLWWHPHNFGVDLEENLAVLSFVLEHFRRLQEELGMRTLSMGDVAAQALGETSP